MNDDPTRTLGDCRAGMDGHGLSESFPSHFQSQPDSDSEMPAWQCPIMMSIMPVIQVALPGRSWLFSRDTVTRAVPAGHPDRITSTVGPRLSASDVRLRAIGPLPVWMMMHDPGPTDRHDRAATANLNRWPGAVLGPTPGPAAARGPPPGRRGTGCSGPCLLPAAGNHGPRPHQLSSV